MVLWKNPLLIKDVQFKMCVRCWSLYFIYFKEKAEVPLCQWTTITSPLAVDMGQFKSRPEHLHICKLFPLYPFYIIICKIKTQSGKFRTPATLYLSFSPTLFLYFSDPLSLCLFKLVFPLPSLSKMVLPIQRRGLFQQSFYCCPQGLVVLFLFLIVRASRRLWIRVRELKIKVDWAFDCRWKSPKLLSKQMLSVTVWGSKQNTKHLHWAPDSQKAGIKSHVGCFLQNQQIFELISREIPASLTAGPKSFLTHCLQKRAATISL